MKLDRLLVIGDKLPGRQTLVGTLIKMTPARLLRIVAPVFLAALATPSWSWNETGHMVIAAIARQDLKARARYEADRLLKLSSDPKSNDFLTAACWADDARTKSNAAWHFINYHFRDDGAATENKPEPENVVWAIQKFTKVLGDKSRSDDERAEALRYLLHFVGDIHQPLHAVARDTDEHPEGDRGGNSFAIQTPALFQSLFRPPKNLHSLWDFGCGLFMPEDRPLSKEALGRIDALAGRLRSEHPGVSFENLSQTDPSGWAQEGLEVAKSTVYHLPEGSMPSAGYLEKGQSISGERATLAGYRLAALLNRLLG